MLKVSKTLPKDLAKQYKILTKAMSNPKIDLSSAPTFSLEGITCIGLCVKVYDGDTAHFVVDFNSVWTKFKCRMYGYNTAEIRGGTPETKARAQVEKKYLESLILNKLVEVQFGKFDKYGRPLATVIVPEKRLDVNKEMVLSGHAREYYGKGEKI